MLKAKRIMAALVAAIALLSFAGCGEQAVEKNLSGLKTTLEKAGYHVVESGDDGKFTSLGIKDAMVFTKEGELGMIYEMNDEAAAKLLESYDNTLVSGVYVISAENDTVLTMFRDFFGLEAGAETGGTGGEQGGTAA